MCVLLELIWWFLKKRCCFSFNVVLPATLETLLLRIQGSADMRWLKPIERFFGLETTVPLQVYGRNVQTWQQVVLVVTAFVSNCRAWTNLNFFLEILYDSLQLRDVECLCACVTPAGSPTGSFLFRTKRVLLSLSLGADFAIEKESLSNLYDSNFMAEKIPS